jgi:hypothetical protein
MAIVPTGSPAWVRNSDHTTYGGNTAKTNWHSQGVTNAQTDVGAEAFCRMVEDLSAVVRTAPFAVLTVKCNDSSPAAPTILQINQMTGVTLVSYAGNTPPAGYPSGARNGDGDVTITWSTALSDDYGVSGNINILHADLGVVSGSAALASYQRVDANADGLYEAVRIFNFTSGGSARQNAQFTLTVVTGPG